MEAKPDHAKAQYLLGMCDVNLNKIPDMKKHLGEYLRLEPNGKEAATAKEMLEALAAELGISQLITMPGRIPIDQVAAAVAAADIGIAPTRLDPFTEMTLSGKVMEYAAMGKPCVASRLPSVAGYFAPDTLAFYDPGDPRSMADSILRLVDDKAETAARVTRTGVRIEELSWTRQFEAYRRVVERLQNRAAARRG